MIVFDELASTKNLILGDCLEILKWLPENSIDSIVTDPPYGLNSKRPGGRSSSTEGAVMKGFMGLEWDGDIPAVEIWVECLRVLKPGGHLLAFAGTRTQHRMACHIEDAGFEIRDMIAWVYGSGFPKSMNVSKAIDRAMGAERELTRPGVDRREGYGDDWDKGDSSTRPRYDRAATEQAAEWEGWGTTLKPALEPITVARKPFSGTVAANVLYHGTGAINIDSCRVGTSGDVGRWPTNLIHDGSEPADLLGEAARFFYCAKASKKDRGENNNHPTVKPTELMAYLCRLVTPPGGTVLDPFMGSGSTGKAAIREGFSFMGVERDPEYFAIAESRVRHDTF